MPKPKSVQRCETCRRRRIKCDAHWPTCGPCAKSGWECPGPSLDYKFQHHDTKSIAATGRTHSPQVLARVKQRIVEEPALSSTELLRSDLIQKLESGAMALSLEYLSVAAYMQYIPAMLGTSACLDAAVECICIASNEPDKAKLADASSAWRVGYARALTLLQNALNHTRESTSSETLATALLLKMLGLGVNDKSAAASKHSSGLAQLMQHRGPEAFRNEIDFAVIEIESANIACAYYRTGQRCFLADESWDGVYRAMIDTASPDNGRMPTKDVELVHVTCQMTMLIDGFKRRSQGAMMGHGPVKQSRNVDLYNLAIRLKTQFQTWSIGDSYERASGLLLGMYVSSAVQLIVVLAYLEVLVSEIPSHIFISNGPFSVIRDVQQSADIAQHAIDVFRLFSQKSKWGAWYVANYLRLVWQTGVVGCMRHNQSLRNSVVLKACEQVGFAEALTLLDQSDFMRSSGES